MATGNSENPNYGYSISLPRNVKSDGSGSRPSCFTTRHFYHSVPGAHNSSSFRYGKRKSSNESMFHPVTKQQITEARIASSMQRLSLTSNNDAQPSSHGAVNTGNSTQRTADEGFFEDSDVSSDEDGVNDLDFDDGGSQRTPQIHIPEDVKKNLARMWDEILPESVMKSINQSSMALVPYKPVEEILLGKVEEENSTRENHPAKVPVEHDERFGNAMQPDDDMDMVELSSWSNK